MGLDGFHWWQGVVEEIMDPLELGRVQVRLYGIHSAEKIPDDATGQGIPTSELPWAEISNGVNSASTSGVGHSPTGIVKGTHAWGFSRDGRDYTNLVLVGTLLGIPLNSSGSKGFEDPDGVYPKITGESDLSRLARGNISDTWVERHSKSVITNKLFVEPKSSFKAKYPFNQVFQSRTGHTVEIDDTENAERMAWAHKMGTFQEYHPNGSSTEHIVKDKYSVVLGDDFIHVGGDVRVFITGNVTQVINGSVNQFVNGNVEETIEGNKNIITDGEISMKASKVTINAPIETSSTITSLGDQIAGGVSTQKHTHGYDVPLHVKSHSPTDPAAGGGNAPTPKSTTNAKAPAQVASPN